MKYASVVPKKLYPHGSDFRSHPRDRSFQLKLWEENVNWSYAKTLIFEKKTKGNALPYLEALPFTG
jgi:hypothetical protein